MSCTVTLHISIVGSTMDFDWVHEWLEQLQNCISWCYTISTSGTAVLKHHNKILVAEVSWTLCWGPVPSTAWLPATAECNACVKLMMVWVQTCIICFAALRLTPKRVGLLKAQSVCKNHLALGGIQNIVGPQKTDSVCACKLVWVSLQIQLTELGSALTACAHAWGVCLLTNEGRLS